MAWETRKRGTRYYTRSKRINGRVVRMYIGADLKGRLAAEEDRERRARQDGARAQWAAVKRRIEEVDGMLDVMFSACSDRMRMELEAAGYHQHAGGEWRKKREQKDG